MGVVVVVCFYLRGHLSDSQLFIFVRYFTQCFCFCLTTNRSLGKVANGVVVVRQFLKLPYFH